MIIYSWELLFLNSKCILEGFFLFLWNLSEASWILFSEERAEGKLSSQRPSPSPLKRVNFSFPGFAACKREVLPENTNKSKVQWKHNIHISFSFQAAHFSSYNFGLFCLVSSFAQTKLLPWSEWLCNCFNIRPPHISRLNVVTIAFVSSYPSATLKGLAIQVGFSFTSSLYWNI